MTDDVVTTTVGEESPLPQTEMTQTTPAQETTDTPVGEGLAPPETVEKTPSVTTSLGEGGAETPFVTAAGAELTLTAVDVGGESFPLPCPVRLELEQSIDSPLDRLQVWLPEDTDLKTAGRLRLSGTYSFYGVIDRAVYDQSPQGRFLKLSCRSLAALLTDSYALAMEINSPSPARLLQTLVPSGEIKGFLYDRYIPQETFEVSRSDTLWRAIEAYCFLSFDGMPRVTDDGYISVQPYPNVRTHRFGENGRSVYRFERVTDRTAPITDLIVEDKNSEAAVRVYNEESLPDLHRRRYTRVEGSWRTNLIRCGKRLIRQSMRNYRYIELQTAALFPVSLGDGVTVDRAEDGVDYRVGRLAVTCDQNGCRTTLRLVNDAYFAV